MIHTEGLTKRFPLAGKKQGETLAVDDLSLDVHQGEVLGFLGPNGAGKTTTVRMLCALVSPSGGRAWVAGRQVGCDDEAIRASVGILTETPGLYVRLDAWTNLAFFARMYGVADVDGQVSRYLKMLGLWERRNEAVGSFSKGMRQKLAIARALLHEPPLLFLDEPTSGLDPEAARTVRDFIAELRSQGRTIWLCTHNLDEADRLCDRIAIIKQRLICVDTPANLRQSLYGSQVSVRLAVPAPNLARLAQSLPFVHQAQATADGLLIALDDPERNNPRLIQTLVEAGGQVQFVEPVRRTLETIYFDLMAQTDEGV